MKLTLKTLFLTVNTKELEILGSLEIGNTSLNLALVVHKKNMRLELIYMRSNSETTKNDKLFLFWGGNVYCILNLAKT